LVSIYDSSLLISSNDFPLVLDPYIVMITVAIIENDAITIIKFRNPDGRNKTNKIGPSAASPRLIPSTIPELNERTLVGKLSEV
jgi:hypothetical protein